jgi:hypothetical protein
MAREQTKCLHVAAGAYKATAMEQLETETAVYPLDLYLNKRPADFEARLQANGMADKIRGACVALRAKLLRGRRPALRGAADTWA